LIQNQNHQYNNILIGGNSSSNKYNYLLYKNKIYKNLFLVLFFSSAFFWSQNVFSENNDSRYYLSYSYMQIRDDFNFKHQLNACCSDKISFFSGIENSLNLTSNYFYSDLIGSSFQLSIAQTNLVFQDFSQEMITKEGALYPIKIKNELDISFVNANITLYLICFNPFKNFFINNGINTGFYFYDNLEYKEVLIDPVNVTFSNDSRIRNKIRLKDKDYAFKYIIGTQFELKYDIPINQKETSFISTSILYNYRIQTMKNQEINNHYFGFSIGLGGILQSTPSITIQE